MERKFNYQVETDGEDDPKSPRQLCGCVVRDKIAECQVLVLVLYW